MAGANDSIFEGEFSSLRNPG